MVIEYIVVWDNPTNQERQSFGSKKAAELFAEELTDVNRSILKISKDVIAFYPIGK